MDEEYYEVEYITQARVEKKRGRKKKLVWKYYVRWKGYGPDDDTWEPAESFEGSEDIINRFWERANVGSRDYRDMSLFKVGEEFLPTGPPRRKGTPKSSKSDVVPSKPISPLLPTPHKVAENKRSFNERSSSVLEDSEDDRPRKRVRSNALPHSHGAAKEVKRIPLPRHSNKIPTLGSIDQDGSPSAPSHPQQKKGFRSSSIDEIVPASDDEADEINKSFTSSPLQQSRQSEVTFNLQHVPRSPRSKVASGSSMVLNTTPSGDEAIHIRDDTGSVDDRDPLFDEPDGQLINLSSHRARAANPLVKMAENPNFAGMDDAISVKARLAGCKPTISSTISEKSKKPGPSRSSSGFLKNSLLTFQKGSLTTVKGTYKKQTDKSRSDMEVADDGYNNESMKEGEDMHLDEDPHLSNNGTVQHPPTAAELAGLYAQNAEILPDFEEDVPTSDSQPLPQSPPAPQPDRAQLARQQSLASLALTKDKLLPSAATTGIMNTPNATWKRPTIFDALGLGSTAFNTVITESSRSSPFSLNLDSTVSVPVALTHPLSSIETIVGKRGPPGKFYSHQAAMSLLDTLRTGGSSGKVVIDINTADDQRRHFDRFCSRLNAGELFVAIAGMDVLAFCSSDNGLVSQRLNIPPSLLGQPGEVLVSQVIIENHSAYADAAANADGREWSRSLLTVG